MDFVFSPSAQRSLSRFASQTMRLARRFADTLGLLLIGVQDGLDLMARYHALSRLSDEALAKRGLTRSGIARAAMEIRPSRRD
jgi:hypothetical protein